MQTVQQRGAAVIKARKLSSAMSAAKAICDHMRDIWTGTSEVKPIYNLYYTWSGKHFLLLHFLKNQQGCLDNPNFVIWWGDNEK